MDSYLLYIFFLSALGGLFVYFERMRRKDSQRYVDELVKLSVAKAHELNAPLILARKLVTSLESGDVDSVPNYIAQFKRVYANVVRQQVDMVDWKDAQLANVEYLDLRALTDEILATFLFDMSRFKVIKHFTETRKVVGDRAKVFSIVSNILKNAFQHSQGVVEISCSDCGEDAVRYIVKNSGASIPKSVVAKLFKPLNARAADGAGLGLAISKKYVELHGGHMNCDSSVGFMSFWFELPALVEAKAVDAPSGWVAVIDDEVWEQKEIAEAFPHKKVECFSHTEDFYQRLHEGKEFEAVITDRFGPGFDVVRDRFSYHTRKKFGFKGKLVLYSNSVFKLQTNYEGFDFAAPKSFLAKDLAKIVENGRI